MNDVDARSNLPGLRGPVDSGRHDARDGYRNGRTDLLDVQDKWLLARRADHSHGNAYVRPVVRDWVSSRWRPVRRPHCRGLRSGSRDLRPRGTLDRPLRVPLGPSLTACCRVGGFTRRRTGRFVPAGCGRGGGTKSTARRSSRSTARATLTTGTRGMSVDPEEEGHRQRRRVARVHELRRVSESHDADGDASIHAVDQRILQEGREPRPRGVLHFALYNLCRPHQTRSGKGRGKVIPAMAAGVESHPWSISQLCELLD